MKKTIAPSYNEWLKWKEMGYMIKYSVWRSSKESPIATIRVRK